MSAEGRRALESWAQWAMVVLILLGGWVSVQQRLSAIEQHLRDQDKQLERMETRLNGRSPH